MLGMKRPSNAKEITLVWEQMFLKFILKFFPFFFFTLRRLNI